MDNTAASAAAALDNLRHQAEWSDRERDAALDRLIERFPIEDVNEAVRERLGDLSGPDGEILLRVVEANSGSSLARALAEALEDQLDLPADRLWSALDVLDGAGILGNYPLLQELWDELNDSLDEDGSIEELVEQIENDPDGIWLALQGLAAVEAEVRPQIIAGLASGKAGAGVIEFFRLLAYSDDPGTRSAALESLSRLPSGSAVSSAWEDLSARHSEPEVRETAIRRLSEPETQLAVQKPRSQSIAVSSPRIQRSLVTAIDGRGRATIALASIRGQTRATAVFVCDIIDGVKEVHGDLTNDTAAAGAAIEAILEGLTDDVIEDTHPLALALLSGCLTMSGPKTPPALRFWVESTVGPDLGAVPFRADFPGWDPSELSFEEMPARAKEVLDRRPDWLDTSTLTYQLAEEICLRDGDSAPDPRRDAGAYRYLFEHRLADQLELYRRMLLWMAWFWRASGEEVLGRSALALASQLSDAQHVVPGHPFTVALTTRSLTVARERLRMGLGRDARGLG